MVALTYEERVKAIQSKWGGYYEPTNLIESLRTGVQGLWKNIESEFRKNVKDRFLTGMLTHAAWSSDTSGCTCLFGSVQALDTPHDDLLNSDEAIVRDVLSLDYDGYITNPWEGDEYRYNDEDDEEEIRVSHWVQVISDSWEAFVKNTSGVGTWGKDDFLELIANESDEETLRELQAKYARLKKTYGLASEIVLDEIASLEKAGFVPA